MNLFDIRAWTVLQKVAVVVALASAYLGSEGLMNDIFGMRYQDNSALTIVFILASGAVFLLFGKKTPKE